MDLSVASCVRLASNDEKHAPLLKQPTSCPRTKSNTLKAGYYS